MLEGAETRFTDVAAKQRGHRLADDGMLPSEERDFVAAQCRLAMIGGGNSVFIEPGELAGSKIFCRLHQIEVLVEIFLLKADPVK